MPQYDTRNSGVSHESGPAAAARLLGDQYHTNRCSHACHPCDLVVLLSININFRSPQTGVVPGDIYIYTRSTVFPHTPVVLVGKPSRASLTPSCKHRIASSACTGTAAIPFGEPRARVPVGVRIIASGFRAYEAEPKALWHATMHIYILCFWSELCTPTSSSAAAAAACVAVTFQPADSAAL